MEQDLLPDEVIQEILQRAMEDKFSRTRPATRHFFEHQASSEGQPRAVTIHKWAISPISPTDSKMLIQHLAGMAVKEVAQVATAITGELIFRKPTLLPGLPLWEDGHALFFSGTNNRRFGVQGGNVFDSTGCHSEDVAGAAQRLQALDPTLDLPYERLMIFCAKPLEKRLIKAAAKAQIPCRVFGVYNYKDERSWVITRDESPCSLLIGRPSFPLPVEGNNLVVGARFTVWIDNPKNAVCVVSKE